MDWAGEVQILLETDCAEATPTWSTVVTYYHDGLNRRVKKDLDTGTDVDYLYDGWQVLEEREWDSGDSKWEPRRQYVYGGFYIDEVLIFDKDTDDDGDCTDGGGSSRYFYAHQANFNVVAVTDSSGDTAEKIKYDPYGEATVTVQGGHSSTGNPYLFQGRRWDDEVELYYFRNRVMSPVLGRFLQRDPVRYKYEFNLYEFGEGAGMLVCDPNGLRSRRSYNPLTWLGAGVDLAGKGLQYVPIVGKTSGHVVRGAGHTVKAAGAITTLEFGAAKEEVARAGEQLLCGIKDPLKIFLMGLMK